MAIKHTVLKRVIILIVVVPGLIILQIAKSENGLSYTLDKKPQCENVIDLDTGRVNIGEQVRVLIILHVF